MDLNHGWRAGMLALLPSTSVDLSRVRVRLVADELEMARWSDLMGRHHPQGWRGMPEFSGQAHLASRVLGLNLRRLSAVWQERYGHPGWVAETFVEQDRQGSCYKTCGWLEVGATKGFRRTPAEGYRKHGVVRRGGI